MESIARNYRLRFPHVLQQSYDPNYYYFRHTDRTRTRDSFRAFVNGLFGDEFEYKQIEANPPSKQPDLLLKVSLLFLLNFLVDSHKFYIISIN